MYNGIPTGQLHVIDSRDTMPTAQLGLTHYMSHAHVHNHNILEMIELFTIFFDDFLVF